MSRLDAALRQLTLANQLTLLRLAAVPALAITLLSGHPGWALGLYAAAAITDRLDGIAARRLGQQTALGAFLDPAADKLMMLVTYIVTAMPDAPRAFPEFALVQHMPWWLAVLVVTRDVLIVTVALGLYLAYGQTRFAPLRIGKWTTAVEMLTGGLVLLANVWTGFPPRGVLVAAIVTAVMIVLSGVGYFLNLTHRERSRDGEEATP